MRPLRLPRTAARSAVAAGWGLRLLPAPPHLFDAVLREFLDGLRHGAGTGTAPLRGRKAG
ncbi:hypothetical protein ACWZEH_29645 [Streptomyces sp. QTS137]